LDEKGYLDVKKYGGRKWGTIPEKVNIRPKSNTRVCAFGIYIPDKDNVFIKCYHKKRSEQYIDFVKEIKKELKEKLYVIQDNGPIHVSKETKEGLKNLEGIEFIFQPYNSPELNKMEPEWSTMQREAIDNRDFDLADQIIESIYNWQEYRNGKRKEIMGQKTFDR
jgi:transposase